MFIPENEIVRQADTIEELCDEFVGIDNNGHINQFKANGMPNDVQTTYEFVKERYLRFHNTKIYGAIWTNKGLIFVAKMKGILPSGEIDWELL